jgi:hypothetical protein
MACITGDNTSIFINHGDLRMNHGGIHTGSVDFFSNIVIQGDGYGVTIGNQAGHENQQEGTVAIGAAAGHSNQQENAIAIGFNAGDTSQGSYAVSLGNCAGSLHQNSYAVAIGSGAGYENQGLNAIAIGRLAGEIDQHANTIVLNATGNVLDTAAPEGFYVAPVRSAQGTRVMTWDPVTSEVTASQNVNASYYTGNASSLTSLTGASTGTYGDSHSVTSVVVTPTGYVSSITSVPIIETSTLDNVLSRGGSTSQAITTSGKITCYDLQVNNVAVFLSHVYEVEVQQLAVGNALVSVGIDNVTGLDSGLIINNLTGTNNVATFFRSLDATYYMGYVADNANTSSNLNIVTNRSLPVHVYGTVTSSNGFIGSGSQLTGLTSVTPSTTWGSANTVPVISIDSTGKLSSISNVLANIRSTQVSDFSAAVGGLTANTISGTITANQVSNLTSYATLNQVVTNDPTTTKTVFFSNATTAFTTVSNVGVSNTNPVHPFVVGKSNLVVGANGFIGVNSVPSSSSQLVIQGSVASNQVLNVSGAVNQTGNLQCWVSNGGVVASVSNVGSFTGPTLSRSAPKTVSGPYTVLTTDSWLLVNVAAVDVTLTLPAASTCPGRELMIRRLQCANDTHRVLSGASNVIRMERTTDPAVAQTVILDHNFAGNQALPVVFWCTLVSDGTYWWQMSGM